MAMLVSFPWVRGNLLLLMDIYAYYAVFGLLVCSGEDGALANDVYGRLLAPRVEPLRAV